MRQLKRKVSIKAAAYQIIMIANNTSKVVFAIFALICTMNAQTIGANGSLIFQNPNPAANPNVISDITRLVSPDAINALRAAVIGAVEQRANQLADTAQNTVNNSVDDVQNTANFAVDAARGAASNVVRTATNAADPIFSILNAINPNTNTNANVAANVRAARNLQQASAGAGGALGGLGGLLSLPLSLLNLPLGLVSGILGAK